MLRKLKFLPFKSVATALLFTVILGPVGLLYSSLWGGSIMIFFGFITVCSKYPVPIILVWLISCIISVATTNRYNKKIMEKFLHEEKNNKASPI